MMIRVRQTIQMVPLYDTHLHFRSLRQQRTRMTTFEALFLVFKSYSKDTSHVIVYKIIFHKHLKEMKDIFIYKQGCHAS
jgi:hypothetical protein